MRGLSPYIYGIHDRGGESILAVKGQVLITESIGASPDSVGGADYTDLVGQSLGVLVRLNYSHDGQGTIPLTDQYADFAATCARFVGQSRGCVIWIIGNEPNHPVERPQGKLIIPQDYGACFRLCLDAIKQVGSQHQVLPAAVGPWNAKTKYPGNELGDWVQYFVDMLHHCGECDGITLHAYTRGASPAMVVSEQRMNAPFQHRRYGFRVYQDFLDCVPAHMRHLPVLITEIDEYDAWVDANTGVVQAIYQEIDNWNQSGGQPIVAGVLYRWLPHDRWGFQEASGVQADLRAAITRGYQWPHGDAQPTQQQESTTLYMPSVPNSIATPNMGLSPRKIDPRIAQRNGDTWLDEYQPAPGETYYRLTEAKWYSPEEAGGRISIFVKVEDENGKLLPNVPVVLNNGGRKIKRTGDADKDPYWPDPYTVDFPMYAAGFGYCVSIDSAPSDRATRLGMGGIGDDAYIGHHSGFWLKYTRVTAPTATPPQPAQPQTPIPRPEAYPEGITQEWLVTALARVLGIESRLAAAFLQVESGGHSYVNGRLVIRFEAHLFRDYLNNDTWFTQHFRYNPDEPWKEQEWRRSPNASWLPVHIEGDFAERQGAEWEAFEFATRVNRNAALRSISMGSAQVMGFNHRTVGYDSPEAMFADYCKSMLNQVIGFFAYCHNRQGLVQAMQDKDWQAMAELYNGEGQVSYYAGELQRVYNELAG